MLSLVVAVGLGYWSGRRLDAWLGTSPWLTLVFLAFGVAAGVLNVYRTLSRALAATRRPGSRRPRAVTERDPWLHHVERVAVASCLAMAAAAWALARGRVAAPAGVVGGGVLAAISYRGIKAGSTRWWGRWAAGRAGGGGRRSGW